MIKLIFILFSILVGSIVINEIKMYLIKRERIRIINKLLGINNNNNNWDSTTT